MHAPLYHFSLSSFGLCLQWPQISAVNVLNVILRSFNFISIQSQSSYFDKNESFSSLTGRGQIQWDFVHGLFEFAIYGGRVDNPFDNRVMVSYLKQLFDPNTLSEQNRGNKRLGPLNMPNSTMARVSIPSF